MQRCSEGVLEEFQKYTVRTRQELKDLRRGSKFWWKRVRGLLEQKVASQGVPALKTPEGEWLVEAKQKADHFGKTFAAKCVLPPLADNLYSASGPPRLQPQVPQVTAAVVLRVLRDLKEDSGTGPDLLPARLLKECAEEFCEVVQALVYRVLLEQDWPDNWRDHWVIPLFKKKAAWNAKNYRGVHLTSQLSKVVERVLQTLLEPYLTHPLAKGEYQFAHTRESGARDALLVLVLSFLLAFNSGLKVVLYCSDVAGAFDKVEAARLTEKLRKLGLPQELLGVLVGWLGPRRARVVVEGCFSEVLVLANMVFQGTVLGPWLWNLYYGDARLAVRKLGFQEVVFADDLNCWKLVPVSTDNKEALAEGRRCQEELHTWGEGNRVEFDSGKESLHVVSHRTPAGGNFKALGVEFDTKLVMVDAVTSLVKECRWKLQQLLRGRSYFDQRELVQLYKAHLLSFLEYRTPGVYHASSSVLEPLDNLQRHFLKEGGLTEEEALSHFSLAPLAVRRDVAMLSVVHRAVLRKGPPQLWVYFTVVDNNSRTTAGDRHRLQLQTYRTGHHLEVLTRSVLGLTEVYNELPPALVESCSTAKAFQKQLQALVCTWAREGKEDWQTLLSPRLRSWERRLTCLRGWSYEARN